MASERKANAIYSAVHERLMRLRMQLWKDPRYANDQLDRMLSEAMHGAADAAVKAYRKPLKGGPDAP